MRRWTAVAVAALVASSAGACSAIVGAPPGPILCEPGIEGVCPDSQSCICLPDADCTCVPCIASPEQCNGADDDCDGIIDDGLDVDRDGDGARACAAGMREDCDDANPLVFPGNPEVCNGYDDDCRLETVETGSCPAGFCGAPITGGAIRCVDPSNCDDVPCRAGELCRAGVCERDVPDDCNSMPALCTAGQRCDPVTGLCVDVGQDGESCQRDSECQSGRCYRREALGLIDSGGICARACCTDANCPDGFYCAAPGSGARGCVMGPRPARPVCARPGDCGGTECRLSSPFRFECTGDSGGNVGGTLCDSDSDCASGLCRTYCLDACGGVDDCPRAPFWSNGERACRYLGRMSESTTSWVTVCVFSAPFGLGADYPDGLQGATCSGNTECREGFCSAGRCSSACCNDDQCPPDHLCAPVDNAGWEMRCRPRVR